MLQEGDTIEYLARVGSPTGQKGVPGQTKVIGPDIPLWTAKYLERGNAVRKFDPDAPLKIKTEETKTSPGQKVKPRAQTKTKENHGKRNGQVKPGSTGQAKTE